MNKLKQINIPLVLIFLVLAFYIGSYIVDDIKQSTVIKQYKVEESDKEIEKQLNESKKYNKEVASGVVETRDAFTENLEEGEVINLFNSQKPFGVVEIPSINVDLPIYDGTTEKQLQIGAGHLKGTSYPTGEKDTRSVITAHRGLQTAKMFRELDKVKIGDIFFIDSYGEKKAYEVYNKEVITPTDVDSIKIEQGEEIVTLLTCEPYMKNTHRLLVNGKRVSYIQPPEKPNINKANDTKPGKPEKIIVKTLSGETKEVKKRSAIKYVSTMSFEDIEIIIAIVLCVGVLLVLIYKAIRRRRKNYEY